MNAPPNKQVPDTIPNPVPVPFAVIAGVWIVALIALNKIYHQIDPLVWISGPALLLIKFWVEADRIGQMKDNPAPRTYTLQPLGVWAQLEQTIKTLPGYFKNVNPHIDHFITKPQKNMPLELQATITVHHPEVAKTDVPAEKQNSMKSQIIMQAKCQPQDNKTVLTYQFKTDPLISREPLDEIIDHIQNHTEQLIKQYTKD